MNIFLLTASYSEATNVDSELSPKLAMKLCLKYNQTWSAKYSGVDYKESETTLKEVLGYCYSDEDELTYKQALVLLKKQQVV